MHKITAQVSISTASFCISVLLIDVNECITNNGGCEQLCHNTIGSYYCSCNSSYTLNTDNHMCDGK